MLLALLQVVWTEMCVSSVCTQPPYNDTNPPFFFFFFFLDFRRFYLLKSLPLSQIKPISDACLCDDFFFSHVVWESFKKRKCFHQKKISSIFSYQTRLELQMRLASLNMIKEGCENESALLILLIFYLGNPHKSNLSLDNKNLKWGEISLWNKCFSLMHIGHN